MLDRTGKLWRGENYIDLAEYISAVQTGGLPVTRVVESICDRCDGRGFRVTVGTAEDRARRTCVRCGRVGYLGDSAERWSESDIMGCRCPCGSEEFAAAVGFAFAEHQPICQDPIDAGQVIGDSLEGSPLAAAVRWISLGLRCLSDNALGIYAEWPVSPVGAGAPGKP